jgi:uncharacterized protein (TIGR02145 family)
MYENTVANAPWGANYATVHWKDADVMPLICRDDSNLWDFIPSTGTIVKYFGSTGITVDLTIPNSLSYMGVTYPIVSVGQNIDNANNRIFPNTSTQLNSVTISDGIITIGNRAFYINRINTVNLGNTVKTINNYAFMNCKIGSLTLPKALQTIGTRVFDNCSLTGSITIPGNVQDIAVNAFQNNPGITQFVIEQYRMQASDPEGYNPDAVPPTYINSPTAVKGRAPFSAVNAAHRVYFMDDPRPVGTLVSIPTYSATNSAKINVRFIMNVTMMPIDTVIAGPGMPAVTIVTKPTMTTNPWVVSMDIDAAHGNGDYVFEVLFNNGRSYLYTVPVNVFHNVVYNGNGHTAGALPATAHYVPAVSVPVLPPAGTFARTCCEFLGWAFSANATIPTFAWNGTSFTPANFSMGGIDTVLYAIWNTSNATIITSPLAATVPALLCHHTANFPQLSVTATGPNLRYHWFRNTTPSAVGAVAITDSTNNTYTPTSDLDPGDYYYYCEVEGDCHTQISNFSGVHTVFNCGNMIDCSALINRYADEDAPNLGYTHPDDSWDVVPAITLDSMQYYLNGVLYSHGTAPSLNGAHFNVGVTTVIVHGYFEDVENVCSFMVVVHGECPATTADSEGNTYAVTPLSGLCWTENLKSTLYADGAPIAWAKPYNSPEYPNTACNAATFGLLYTWYSAVRIPEGDNTTTPATNTLGFIQGICPNGWHIPEETEWNLLNAYPAEDLKSTTLWLAPNAGTNLTGFNALPAGMCSGATNKFINLYGETGWWSSDSSGATVQYFYLSYYCDVIREITSIKSDGLSVRCIMDY